MSLDYIIKPIMIIDQETLPPLNSILEALTEEGNIPIIVISDPENEDFKNCNNAKPANVPDLIYIIFVINYQTEFLV